MANEEKKAIARDSLFMKSLTERHVEVLLERAQFRHYDRGETIFIQDETASFVHVVLDGWVKLYRISPNGSEAVVSVFARGQSFGEAVALRSAPYPVSAEAVTPVELMALPATALVSMIRDDPELSVRILASTFTHLHSLVAQLEALKAQTGAQRVAEFLLSLCRGKSGACEVVLPYDKVLIAGRLGMKPESLSRAFGRLKKAGVTIRRNHAEIADVAMLTDYVKSDPADAWHKGG